MPEVRYCSLLAWPADSPRAERVIRVSDLLHEPVLGEAKSDNRDPQHALAGGYPIVLSQGIVDRVERERMMSTVDLDDQLHPVPGDVEINPAVRSTSQRLM